MERLILLSTSSIGLTFIIQYSYILKPLREKLKSKGEIFKEFFKCSMCIGFWSGLMIYFFKTFDMFDSIIFGFAISFLSTLFDFVIDYFDNIINFLKNEK